MWNIKEIYYFALTYILHFTNFGDLNKAKTTTQELKIIYWLSSGLHFRLQQIHACRGEIQKDRPHLHIVYIWTNYSRQSKPIWATWCTMWLQTSPHRGATMSVSVLCKYCNYTSMLHSLFQIQTLSDVKDGTNMTEAWLSNIKKDIKMARAEKCLLKPMI